MINIGNVIIPAVMSVVIVYGLYSQVDIFDCFVKGARDGFKTAIGILPPLVALMTCVGMFKASGALDVITHFLRPLADIILLPEELLPLAVLRPISGSGALAIYNGILRDFGPDSYIGRVASVLEGSSETTFYTIAVYYGAIGITKTRHTLPASLTADVAGFFMSALMVRLFFGILDG